jgi:phosphocarrier protein
MIKKEVVVKNKAGIHTRPAATLVKSAGKYKCEFYIIKDGIQINGKSIIGVMSLAVEQGVQLNLVFDGEDENEACHEIVELFEKGFDEL